MKQEKMRKHHLMRVLLFTALPIILLYACRKELHQISDAKQSLTVEEAKGYMAQKERVTIPIDQMSFSEFNNKDLAYAWDKAKVSMNDQGNVIEVPLTNKNKGYVIGSDNPDLANKSITTLIVTKNEKGEKASFLMTLVADQSYLKDKPDDLLKNSYKKYTSSFSGLVLYHKPEGVFIGGDRYLKGQKVGPLVAVSELELRKIGSASSSQNKVMNYALPGDGDCTYYTMWDYNATCYPVGPDVYCEWEASIRWTYRVCSNTSGGSGGTGSSPDPYSLNNDLALPCEDVEAPDFVDTIRIRQELAQDALKNILPPEYHSFIKFGANGALDKTLLASAGSVVNMPQSNIYNVLIWLAQEPTIDINIWLKSKWFGLTTRHPDGGGFRYLTDEQILEGVTVVPGVLPVEPGLPVTGSSTEGNIYIDKGAASSPRRLAYVTAHELLGHMYSFVKGLPFTHGNPTFESWVSSIEAEANKNWKLIKKWKKSKDECPE